MPQVSLSPESSCRQITIQKVLGERNTLEQIINISDELAGHTSKINEAARTSFRFTKVFTLWFASLLNRLAATVLLYSDHRAQGAVNLSGSLRYKTDRVYK